jgi:cation diffusion facilitator family transporter
MADADTLDRQQENREKTWVALSSLLAASVLALLKLFVGIRTNSLGILSEAAHSTLDLVAAGATLWAVRVSGRPASREYTYGRGKFENLSALLETVLLLATCLWIVYEAVQRLVFKQRIEVDASLWAFLVVMLSMAVDFSRSRALRHHARKYDSQALEADALHFSTDIWSSGVVLLGLVGAWVAGRIGAPWLRSADTVAALGVAAIIVGVSLRLGKKSLDDLMDRIPVDLQERVSQAAAAVPGVLQVTKVRLRRSGPENFADVTLSVGQATSFEKAHEIADCAAAAVRAVLPRADVVVHAEPAAQAEEELTTTVRVVAARHGLGAHGVRIFDDQGAREIEFHLEVNGQLSLEEAHRQATEFEQDLRATVPGLSRIVSHIEPVGDATATVRGEPAAQIQVRAALEDFYRKHGYPLDPHHVVAQRVGDQLHVSFHCRLGAATALTDAHDLTVRLEEYLRSRIGNLGRVVIHVEPVKPPGDGGSQQDETSPIK